jgi:hypothetical protein
MIDDDEWSWKLSLLFLVGIPLSCFPAFLVSRFPDSGASLFVETRFPAFALADFRVAQRKFLRILKNALPPIPGVRRDGHRQFVRDEEALISGFSGFGV